MQLFVRGSGSRTTCVNVDPGCDVAEVKASIQACTGIPVDYQGLVYAGRQLQDAQPLVSYHIQAGSTLHLVYHLLGGKGGFGALLRGQGRDGKITENFDACRDLSGRRIRHQSAQQKLSQWKEESKERELERLAMQHIKEQAKKARREEQEKVDVHAIQEAQEEAITRTQQAVQDALKASMTVKAGSNGASGSVASASSGSGSGGEGSGSGSGSPKPGSAGVKRKEGAPAASGAPPAKKSKMLDMLADVGSDTSSSDEEEGA